AVHWIRRVTSGNSAVPAKRVLAGLAMELADATILDAALHSAPGDVDGGEEAFAPADRAVLATLLGVQPAESDLQQMTSEKTTALVAAIGAMSPPGANPPAAARLARASRVAGSDGSRVLLTLARMLAMDAPAEALEAHVRAAAKERPDLVRALA